MAWVSSAVTVGSAAYGAYSSNNAKNDAVDAAATQNSAIADQLDTTQNNIQSLLDSQSDPVQLFQDIFTQYPQLLAQVLPSLTQQAVDTSSTITQSNINNFQTALGQLYPDYARLQAGQVQQIDSLNPANLGQEEILAKARQVGTLIPAGTLDPSTGAVAGGTTNPVSLYRNMVSGMYDDRRNQYLSAVSGYLGNAENSASRQQSSAENFLTGFLGQASGQAQYLTGATLTQESQNMSDQWNLLNTLLKIPTATVNTGAYDQATASSIQTAISALGTAYGKSQTSAKTGGSSSYATALAK